MGLWRKIFILSFKEKSVYRFDYLVGTVFSFLYIILKIYLWKGVYGYEDTAVKGILLNDMIAYSVLAGFTSGITKTSVMHDFNDSVCSGTISSELLLPMGLKKYLFIHSVAKNMFQTIYGILPSMLIAMLFFGIHSQIRYPNLILYLLAVVMGTVINFLYHFLLGSSVVWLQNSFFLSNVDSVLMQLFSGAFVPIWFFPQGLKALSDFLPFRYIVFEPTAILLQGKHVFEVLPVLGMQLLWIAVLFPAAALAWNRGRRRIMIQGG